MCELAIGDQFGKQIQQGNQIPPGQNFGLPVVTQPNNGILPFFQDLSIQDLSRNVKGLEASAWSGSMNSTPSWSSHGLRSNGWTTRTNIWPN
jgi:hypothetical protein